MSKSISPAFTAYLKLNAFVLESEVFGENAPRLKTQDITQFFQNGVHQGGHYQQYEAA